MTDDEKTTSILLSIKKVKKVSGSDIAVLNTSLNRGWLIIGSSKKINSDGSTDEIFYLGWSSNSGNLIDVLKEQADFS